MFLAIINDTYAEVKNDMSTQESEFELGEYFKKSYGKVLERLHFKRDRVIDIQEALKNADINKDGVIEFEEWRRDLKARGYTDTEIENVFTRYDVDGDGVLRIGEQDTFKNDLSAQENDLNKNIKGFKDGTQDRKLSRKSVQDNTNHITFDEFSILRQRMDRMEYSVGNIVSRIDDVLQKLESMEKVKAKRREALTRILNTMTNENHLNEEHKQERIEKMIREELLENNFDRQTPGAPRYGYQSAPSARPEQIDDEY
ncbi:unnamed protein product [Adineta steineri]|uniref:EF-hand domain-containing protein n=1 Tax=Adineta steineri TaxID=433720 RepID=A0A814DE93_9BILA|nr:unnamed protein product [Adineta steineri]